MKNATLFVPALTAALFAAAPARATWFNRCRTIGCAFDRMFADYGDGLAYSSYSSGVDFSTSEKEYRIFYALPGVDQKNVKVTYLDVVLTVQAGDAKESGPKDRENYIRAFRYSLRLPDDTDESSIVADHKEGLLTVTVKRDQKKAERAARVIEVNKKK